MNPPSPVFLLPGIGMVVVGVAAVIIWHRRGRTGLWFAFVVGALAWTLAVALKFAWAIPFNAPVKRGLEHVLPKIASDPLYWLYIGLLTGVLECGIALAFVLRTRLRRANWDAAMAFGIGFGATEAIALGLVSFLGLASAILFFDVLPADAKGKILASLGQAAGHEITFISIPIIERLSTLLIHCFSCVLIVYGIRVRQWRWFWIAFFYKTTVDGLAAGSVLGWHVKQSLTKMVQFEGIVVLLAVFALVGLWFLRARFTALDAAQQVVATQKPEASGAHVASQV